jgi:hypothetical protein
VRRTANSDHWRWVSTPSWRRTSATVTSSCQRWTNQAGICAGAAAGSVQSRAGVWKRPAGSRSSTHRSGTGARPLWDQTAVAETTSTVRWPAPYQSARVSGAPPVAGSAATAASVGWRRPLTRGPPRRPGRRGGAGSSRAASSRRRVPR